jgi:hypothetical protein
MRLPSPSTSNFDIPCSIFSSCRLHPAAFIVFRGSVFIHDSFLLTDKPVSESGAQRTHSKTLPRDSCAPFLAKRKR